MATTAEVFALIMRDGDRCYLCGQSVRGVPVHVEHVKPKARDGSDGLENKRVAHADCNVWKGQKPVVAA